MSQKAQRHVKKNIINSFGSLGYLFCLLQWFWAVMLYFSVVKSLNLLVSPEATQQTEQSSDFTLVLPDSLQVIVLAIVVIIMVVVTIYALVKIPMDAVKTSDKIVHKAAETMAPMVIKAQHKPDTQKTRIKITSRLTLAIKLLLIVIPVALAAASGLLEKQSINYTIAMTISYGLAFCSVAFFATQYLLAGLLHVKISDVR